MLPFFDPYRDFTTISIVLRIALAAVCGSIIGIEREIKRRPAGFRTHILICIGAAITTLTSQYLALMLHYNTDTARLGAQVVAGVGFIGAGTIVVGKHQRVKGLTTAAGLWVLAIIGLAIGSGFYEGAVIATFLVFLTEWVLALLEYRLMQSSPEVTIMVEFQNQQSLASMLEMFREQKIKLLHMEITRNTVNENNNGCVIFYLRLNKSWSPNQLLDTICNMQDIDHAVKV